VAVGKVPGMSNFKSFEGNLASNIDKSNHKEKHINDERNLKSSSVKKLSIDKSISIIRNKTNSNSNENDMEIEVNKDYTLNMKNNIL